MRRRTLLPVICGAIATQVLPATMASAGIACGAFHRVATPDAGSLSNEVDAIDAASPHAAWVVGTWSTASKEGGLILRFDGAKWLVQKPKAAAGAVNLQAVAARIPSDVWAVGQRLVRGQGFERTVALHWNGASWRRFPTPNANAFDNSLRGVVAFARDDVWAVGTTFSDTEATTTLILHWNGSAWSIVPSPSRGARNFLNAVEGAGPGDVWAVGQRARTTTGEGEKTLALHWDGTHWTLEPTPNAGTASNILFGITAVGHHDVWAVGSGRGGGRTLALHWDGTDWSVIHTPNVGSGPNELDDVAAVNGNDVWAIGNHLTGGLGLQAQAIRWNGAAWTKVPVEEAGTLDTGLAGIARIPGTGRLLAAGDFSDSKQDPLHTLVEQGC